MINTICLFTGKLPAAAVQPQIMVMKRLKVLLAYKQYAAPVIHYSTETDFLCVKRYFLK